MKAPILAHVTWYKMPVLNLDGGSLCSVWWALSAAVFGRVVSVGFGLIPRPVFARGCMCSMNEIVNLNIADATRGKLRLENCDSLV